MTKMDKKLKTLQGILDNCGFEHFKTADYDFTQPDSMDESDSGGVWDMAGDMAFDILEMAAPTETNTDAFERMKIDLQSLLYNLMCEYKTEQEND